MSNPEAKSDQQQPFSANDDDDEEEEENDSDDLEDEEETDDDDAFTEPDLPERRTPEERAGEHKFKLESLFRRMQTGPVQLRVHDVIVRGNKKTKDYIIEVETEALKSARTMQELVRASTAMNTRLQALEVFDSATITLKSGPPELPDTTNVIIEVVETQIPLSGEIGAYTEAEASGSYTVEGSLKYKNMFGYGDIWDGSLKYGCDHSAEVSAGVSLPRFKGLVTPLTARAYLLSQDWLKFSSYREQSLGLSLGLFSSSRHDLTYNLAWHALMDPSRMSSKTVWSQLGHNLLSSLKYTFKIDQRNSSLRPTQGYSFVSTTQIGGLSPDSQSVRFLHQELDLQCAIPLGFYRAALNFGVSAGVVLPLGDGGSTALWGFKARGLGLTEPRRQINDENADPPERDCLGGDLAFSALADLSFDLPFSWVREKGIHAHVFACAGNVTKLTENEYRNFTPQKFMESAGGSVGVGFVIPTSLFRMELNYCHILKKNDHDRAKSGIWLTFSTPA
ncbi:hypothetical protein SLA2020_415210 [Shorea laevis]